MSGPGFVILGVYIPNQADTAQRPCCGRLLAVTPGLYSTLLASPLRFDHLIPEEPGDVRDMLARRGTTLADVAEDLRVDVQELWQLNPHLQGGGRTPSDPAYAVKVPSAELVVAAPNAEVMAEEYVFDGPGGSMNVPLGSRRKAQVGSRPAGQPGPRRPQPVRGPLPRRG